ncbi:MAG: hypothetical protein FJ396_05105, partial [Verrucomicrobia bacterium]|nr:hypothetical protein [Verrucomicrobiota bacterium]
MRTRSLSDLLASLLAASLLTTAAVALQAADLSKPGRRILAADDSTRRLAIIAPDGSFEWEIPVTAIHDAHVLPNGHVLLQQGW